MKVLFVCHRVPFPPKRGGKIRPFNVIRHLHESGHQVTVASLARTQAEAVEAEGLAAHCTSRIVEIVDDMTAWPRMVAWLPTTRPSSFGYFYSRRLKKRIDAELATGAYDLIFVHCSSVAPYVADARGPFKVLDFGDMDSQKWREYAQHRAFPLSAGYWLEAAKLERTERALAAKFDLATCTTQAEMESLRALGANGPTAWFPNGVDTDFFKPLDDRYEPDLVTFIGRMDYYPNQQAVARFCAQVLPVLQRRRPGTRFTVVGADPSVEIRDLGKLPGVTVTGSVADVRPYVRRSALTIAPLQIARGTQNKILESMAMGVPVVCSRQAAGGVDAVPGEHLLVHDDNEQLIEATVTVLDSPELRHRLAAAGRARVLSNHSWPGSMRRLDALVASQIGKRAAA
jgi:sugar transferase (PEP-CTERM/EpsH1 system associated)